LVVVWAVVLHRTPFGRWVYAIGTNEEAARYSGVPVGRVVMLLFVWTGVLAGLGSMVMVSRLSVARYDMATGLELDAITAVVLGGTDIFGGRGSIVGTVAALALMGVLREAMGLANMQAESRLLVIGALLVLSIAVPNVLRRRRS
jgi:rhamnose transport system permease protein